MRAHSAARECATLYGSPDQSPAVILGSQLVLDLNGDLGVTLAIGKVSNWADQSTFGNSPSQPTAARRPPASGLLNGHVGIACATGSNQWLVMASGFTGIAVGDKPRLYFVADLSPTACGAFELTDSVAANRVMNLTANGAAASGTAILGGSAVNRFASIATSVGAKRYGSLVNSADQSETRVDDASAVSAATAGGLTRAPTRMTIGILGDGVTWPASATFYRILIANPAPSGGQHAQLVSYLKHYYNI